MEIDWPYDNKQYRGENWQLHYQAHTEASPEKRASPAKEARPQIFVNSQENRQISRSTHIGSKAALSVKNLGVNKYFQHFQMNKSQRTLAKQSAQPAALMAKSTVLLKQPKPTLQVKKALQPSTSKLLQQHYKVQYKQM